MTYEDGSAVGAHFEASITILSLYLHVTAKLSLAVNQRGLAGHSTISQYT